MARKKTKQSQSLPLIEELDSRTLFSADIEGLLVTDLSAQTDDLSISDTLTPVNTSSTDNFSKYSPDELVIIDTNTPDYQTLLDDIIKNTTKGQVIKFILLDSNRDGIEQVSETLAEYQDLGAVHIISHGSDGSAQLGNTQLDSDSLFSYSESIASWGTAFSDSGDLLFYGCNLTATENGQSLINDIANLTNADIAASEDLTGNAKLGGNWELEYQTGSIESHVIVSAELQRSYQGTLATDALTTAYSQRVQGGGVVVDTAGMRSDPEFSGGTLTPTFNITGIPASAIVKDAFLYVTELDRGILDNSFNLNDGTTTTGYTLIQIGNSGDPSWTASGTVTFRGNVSSLVTGNGSYTLSGADLLGSDDYEGASLVVVYEDVNASNEALITISDGTITTSLSLSLNQALELNGGSAIGNPFNKATLTLVAFDGQDSLNEPEVYIQASGAGSPSEILPINSFGSDIGGSEQYEEDITAYISQTDSSVTITQASNPSLSDSIIYPLAITVIDYAAPTNLTLSQSTPIAIINAGFETNVLADGDDGFILPGWTGATAIAGEYNPPVTDYPDEAPEGDNVGFIDTSFGGHEIYQDLTETFEAGRDYTLSAMIGDKLDANESSGWKMILIAGNQALGQVTNTDFNPANGEFIKATLHLDAETLETYSAEYGSTLRIQFENIGNPANVNDAHFDDVQLEYTSISVSDNAANGTVVADVSSVTDPDAGDTHTYTLTDTAGGRFAIDNTTGVITVANGALLNYTNNSSHNITIRATDSTLLTYDEVVTIQVRQPLHNIVGAQTTHEDNDLSFNTANGNLVSINDPGLSNDSLYTTLSVSNGTLTLSQITGLSFTTGTGSADTSMTFTGSLANMNAALDGMSFSPTADYNGAASLQLTTFDDAGLLGAYSFDAAANLGADDGPGTANDGTVSGATQATGTNRGNALNFVDNAPNDAVTINGLFGTPANVTLSAWVDFTKPTEVANGKAEIISLGDAVVLRVGGTGSGSLDGVIGFFYDGTNWNEIEFNTPISGTGWHHVAYTFDDTTDTQKLYFDGIEVASGANTSSISYTSPTDAGGTSTNTTIGTHSDPDNNQFAFAGNIDDVRIYDYALTAQDIVNIKNAPPGTDSDTVSITINAANDAPTLTANALNPTYTENDENAASVFDTAIISTLDAGQKIDELIFTISNVTQSGLERINLDGSTFFLANGVSGTTVNTSYDYSVSLSGSTATVVMTTTGASTTQISNLIHSIEYKNSSEDPTTADRVITITSIKDDGGTANGGSNTTSPNIASTVTVIAVNDAPDIDTTLTERTPLNTPLLFSTSNSNAITLSDVDIGSGNAEVTLNVTNGTLSLASISNLSFSAGTGTTDTSMTFSGKLIDINAALNGLQYSPTTGFSGSSTLQIVANDLGNSGSGTSLTDSTSIFIGVSNTTPVSTDDPGDYDSEIVTLNPVSNWRLGESSGTTLADNGSAAATGTVNGATLGQPGALNGSSNTAANFDGTDDYIEIPHTSDFLLDNGTIQLWFNADTVGTKQSLFSKDHNTFGTGGHLSIWLTDSGTLQVRLQDTAISHYVESSSIVTTGQWHHVAFSFGANGMELYLDGKIIDVNGYTGGLGTTSGGTGNIESIVLGTTNSKSTQGTVDNLVNYFQGAIDEVSITGNQLNGELIKDIYASGVQHYTLVENTSLTIPSSAGVLINDTDEDGDAITAVLVNGPIFASSFTLNPNGSFDYTPNAGFNGTDSFTYQASDGGNDSNIATATITVTGSNDAPTVNPTASDTGTEDTDVVYTHAQMLSLVGGTDPDDTNDFLSIAITNVVNGTLVSTGSGTGTTFTFTPTLNFVGNMTFDYQVSDDTPAVSTTGTATVAISAVNDNPVLTTSPGGGTFVENNFVIVDTTASITDIDLVDFDSAVLTVSVTNNGTANDRLSIFNEGSGAGQVEVSGSNILIDSTLMATFSGGVGVSDPLLITFTSQADSTTVTNIAQKIIYTNASDNPSVLQREISLQISDGDGGNSEIKTRIVNISAVNDAPVVNGVITPLSATEQVPLAIHNQGFVVSDIDGAGVNITTQLFVTEGTIAVAPGNSGVTITSTVGPNDIWLSGTLAQLNNLLSGSTTGTITYTHNSDTPPASVDFTLTVNDQGNSGSDPGLTGNATSEEGSFTRTINIAAVNDIPTLSSFTAVIDTTLEDTEVELTFAELLLQGNEADVDGTVDAFVVNAISTGTLKIGSDSVSASAWAAGSNDIINASLNAYWTPNTNSNGNLDIFEVIVRDNDAANSSTNITAQVTVTPINDAPVNTVPVTQIVNEDTALVFNTTNGNLLSINDVDSGSNSLRVTLTATNGLMTLSQTTGLIFNVGDGTADATLIFAGSLANINAALDGLIFFSDQNFNGAANIQITTDDLTLKTLNEDSNLQGFYTFDNTGDLGNDDSVGGLNDGVVNGAITSNDVTRGNVLSFDGNDDVQITGVFGSPAEVTLAGWVNLDLGFSDGYVISLAEGVGIVADEGGNGVSGYFYDGSDWESTLSNQSIAGTGWRHVAYTFSDSGNAQTLYIDGIEVGSTNFTASPSYSLGTDSYIGRHGYDSVGHFNGKIDEARIYDRALTAGEIKTLVDGQVTIDRDNIAITVNAVNDAPTVNATASGTGTEDTDTVYTHAQMLTLSGAADGDDVDADLSIAITNITNGTLAMTGGSGGAGTTFTFTPTLNFVGNMTFDYQVSDDTPAASTTGTATVAISAVNDLPVATANTVSTNEDTAHTFTLGEFSFTDIESHALASVSLSNLSLAGGTLEHSGGTTVSNGTTLTVAQILTLIYTPANHANGSPLATFDFTVNDTGTGVVAAQMSINVTAVNDAPEIDLNGVPAGIDYTTTFIEGNGAINITSAGVTLTDIDSISLNSVVVTLTNRLDPASQESLSASTGGTSLSAIWSSATDTLTISPSGSQPGNLANYLSVLSAVQYNNTSNDPDLTTRTVTFVANDGPDTSVLATTTITMSAVNDEPVTDPASASGNEDDASIAITLGGSDVDGTVQSYSLSSLPANGILYSDAGLSSVAATGTDYAASGESLTLYFVPANNWNGATTFQFAAKDDLGLADATLATATITVSAVNDAPVATVPAATSLTEFVPYTFSTGSSNLISIADIDSGSNSVEVTLTATNGLLTLFGSTATLSFTTGDGSNDSVMTFTGSQADINTTLDGMTFISTTNHGGTGSLQIDVSDLGNSGSGNVLTDSKSIAIAIIEISGGTLTGDEFLQGNFIEVGISSDGAIGSNSGAPAGFVLNGQKLGVITDRNKDGWATGTPNYDGDHVLQGTHEEGWGLRINGTNYNNNNINVQEIAGDLGSVIDTGAEQSVLWSGGVDGINVLTTHQVEQNGQFIEFQVTLTNTTASALTDVYYMRNADPDNNQQTSAEGFTTTNSIISQGNDGSGIARVEAGQSDGSYLGLVGFGSNARVTHGGFSNRNPVDVFDGTGGLNASGTFAADQAISLAFKFDTIAAGETVTLRYQYIVNDPVEPGIDLDLDGSSGAPGPDFLTTFTEGGSAVNITDIDAIVFDPDSANLDSMTVTLTNQPDGILETLSAITVGTSINASYNSGTGILTLSNSDTLAHYQQVFRSITYNNTSLSPDTTDRTIAITADDGSNTSSIATSVINIVSTNDAPVNTAPASIAVTEDLASPLTGLSIADSDAGSGTMLVTLSVPSGTLAAASSGGVVVGGSSSALTLSGNVTAINAFIAASNVTYTTALNANNSVNLTLLTSDQGNTGTGGTLTDTDIISLTVTPVNDAPLATNLTTTSSYTEGAASVAITDIVVSDVDTGESITATLTLANTATGNLSSNDGATYTSGNGEWTITGSVSAVNTALANLAFTPLTDNDLDTSIAVSIDDGDEDTSGPLTGTITLDVAPVNDAPLATNLTTTSSYTEGAASVAITDIVVSDVDTGESITATLTLANTATGSLSSNDGATYTSGNGEWTITGSVSAVNTALANLAFTPLTDNDLDTSIAVSIDDGDEDTSGPLTGTITLDVAPVNDAPLATNLTTTSSYTEGAASVAITDIVVSDVDTGESITATLTLANTATGSLSSNDGATYTSGNGEWTITGSVSAVNTALANLAFTPLTDNDLDTSIAVSIDDGDEDTSGPLTGTITLDVTPVNDAPLATNLTTTSSYTEGAASVAITDIVVSDVDTGESITATLTLANTATGSLSSNDGATYTSGNGEWTITGSVSAVNTALANLAFTPLTDNDLDTSIAVSIDDGDEDTSGPLTGTITLDVAPVNDAPLATNLTTTSSYTEGAASVAITDIVVSDVDTGESITATLTLANTATGSLSSNDGATYTSGNGEWTITGSVSAVNTALANLAFTPLTDNDLDTSIAVSIDDGDEDTSGPLTGTITLDVAPVNDAPLATNLTTTSSYTEGAASVAITDIVVSDVDTGESITATLTLANTATGSLSSNDGATYTSGNGEWTITGSVSAVNTALANLAFTPLTDNDLDTSIAVSIDDGDEDTSGPLTGTITLDVTPVNDAPLATNLTTTSSYTEGAASVAITDIVVSDVDTGESITATLTLANTATGSLSSNDGATYTSGNGEWTITGSVSAVNTALANLAFTPLTDNDLDTSIAVSIDDGDEDTSGPLTGTITLDVAPVNDAPLATNLTTTSSYTEGAASVAITDIVVSDVDTGESITATLTLANTATGSLSSNDGATYTSGNGEWTITGSVSAVNTALANLAFTPLTDNDLDTSIAVSIDDGDEDTSGPLTGTITLDVTPVNDAPLATNLTTTSSYTEGAASVAITDIVVSDVDTGESITATLTLANTATGSLSSNDGATYTSGNGEWTITGSVSAVNTALANLAFTPLTDNDLDTSIAVSIDDGDEDTSGPLTGTITLDVAPVNDAPLATNLTTTSSYTEGAASVAITDIVVSDVDTGESITATLTLANTATGSLSSNDGATYTSGNGEWTITGSVSAVNTALANLAFTPLTDNDLDTSIAVSIDDGDEDTSGPLTGTITLDVAPVNDAPLATNLTTTSSYTEGAASVAITDIVVSDVDTGESITATLTLANTATGSLSSNDGATYTSGNGEWTITGSVSAVNTALANLAFTPLTDNDLDTSIAVSIDDGDEDTSGPLTGTITLDVTPVNDAPLATNLTTTSSYTEGAASVAITDIVVSDVDTGESITATLTLANTATGSLSSNDGATYTSGNGEWTITGSVSAVNTALANLAFTPLTDNDLDTSIAVSIDDGDEDTSGPLTGTITLDVAPVNDAPLATNLTTTSSYTEGAASVAITDIVVSDVDTGNPLLRH